MRCMMVQGAYGSKSTFMTAGERRGKTGVTADCDKIEFRLFNSSSIFNITCSRRVIIKIELELINLNSILSRSAVTPVFPRGGSRSTVYSSDTLGTSLIQGYNRAATGSASMMVHGAGLGLTSLDVLAQLIGAHRMRGQ